MTENEKEPILKVQNNRKFNREFSMKQVFEVDYLYSPLGLMLHFQKAEKCQYKA